ncbi:MAG: hypothetical protein LBH67_02625 [Rickettsia sp.]|nr:hypothetical protein [Rickettsia sp.]
MLIGLAIYSNDLENWIFFKKQFFKAEEYTKISEIISNYLLVRGRTSGIMSNIIFKHEIL